MKIVCEECNTILVKPPLTPKRMESMTILNNKEYIKDKTILLGKFFKVYSKNIKELNDIEQNAFRTYLKRREKIHEEKIKVADLFDKRVVEDFEQWKTK